MVSGFDCKKNLQVPESIVFLCKQAPTILFRHKLAGKPVTLCSSRGCELKGMVKLLHVAYGGTGGVARVVADIASYHDKTRFKAVVVLVGKEVDPVYLEHLNKNGVQGVLLQKTKKWDWRYFWKLRKIIAENRPEAIFLHTPAAYYWGRFSVIGLGVKMVFSVEHSSLTSYHGIFGRFINFIQSLLLTDKVVCVSGGVKSAVQKHIRLPDKKFIVIENGIIVENYRPVDLSGLLKVRPVRLKMVSRLEGKKDPATLIRAVKMVLEQGVDVRADFVGDGALRVEMEELSSRLGVSDRVFFLGTRSDIASLLLDTDIFVLSTHGEGLPVALLEAMAAGLPCIATAVAGNLDVIEDQVSGLLVPENDVLALSKAIVFLALNPEKACRFAQAARKRALEKFDVRLTARKYEELLKEVSFLKGDGDKPA